MRVRFQWTDSTAPKAAYSLNRFGFSAGGPLFIPKLFSFPKVFWFVNYAGNLPAQRCRSGVQRTDGWRSAPAIFRDCSDIIYVPNTPQALLAGLTPGTPFPNNMIPPACISPIAQGLLQYIPLPNQAVGSTNQDYRLIAANPNNSQSLNTRFNTTRDAARHAGDHLQFPGARFGHLRDVRVLRFDPGLRQQRGGQLAASLRDAKLQ